jgi:hypothetical protein
MPPLEDDLQGYGDVPGYEEGLVPVGTHDGFDEHDAIRMEEVDQSLLPQVDAMQVGTTPAPRHATSTGKDREPIIQFPEEEEEHQSVEKERNQVNIMMNKHILRNMMQAMSQGSGSKSGSFGPRSSDMIPPMRGLSNLQVSFGSDGDVVMTSADRVLVKRAADDEEVQGGRLDLTLGLDYGGDREREGCQEERGDVQAHTSKLPVGEQGPGQRIVRTGHVKAEIKARPNVWSRQVQ